jgi:hypothetical protein
MRVGTLVPQPVAESSGGGRIDRHPIDGHLRQRRPTASHLTAGRGCDYLRGTALTMRLQPPRPAKLSAATLK